GQQLAQSRRKIVRLRARHFLQHRLHTLEFIGQHRLEQVDLARKMSIKCLFADPQFLRQIVHGHVAESVTEKVRPRRIHYSLSNRRVLSAYRSRFVPALHLVWFGSRGSRYSTTLDRLFYARIGAPLRPICTRSLHRARLLFRLKRKREMDQGCPTDKIDWQQDSLPGFTA